MPDLAARFGLQGRSVHKLVTAVPAGVECENCTQEMVFSARDPRRIQFADCPSCGRARCLGHSAPRACPLAPGSMNPQSRGPSLLEHREFPSAAGHHVVLAGPACWWRMAETPTFR